MIIKNKKENYNVNLVRTGKCSVKCPLSTRENKNTNKFRRNSPRASLNSIIMNIEHLRNIL